MKFTAIGAATATATALTVGIPPDPQPKPEPRLVDANVDLAAAVNPFPQPDDIPDITGGLGSAGYDFTQTALDLVVRAVVENFNLAALAQAAGLDPESLVEGLLGDPNFVLDQVLGGLLGEVPINLAPALLDILEPVLGDLAAGLVLNTLLLPLLSSLNITDGQGVTDLLSILEAVGLDLSDPLNLANLDVPGLNVITAGPAFTLLKLLGVDLGWVPALPNSVAAEINNTEYLELGVNGLVNAILDRLTPGEDDGLIGQLRNLLDDLTEGIPDLTHVRIPVSVGIGLGAFAIATGYQQVLDDLENQPGGSGEGTDPLLGSFTILPMLLAFNPARPNGGMFARLYPIASLLGIDVVNPETKVESRGGFAQLPLGLSLGGANLIPILVDLGIEYHPSMDFAAWPNPFSLANNLAAGVLPTYFLRGISLDTVPDQLVAEILDLIGDVGEGDLALNIYLTLKSETLPLLEPLYLAADLLNLVTLGALPINPFSLVANAFAPALTSLVNLGYTDVVYNPETGAYERTLDEADIPTPFGSFPDVNWGQVPGVVINQLLQGIQKEFFSGNPTPGTPNAITSLLSLLTGGGLGPLGDLGGLLQGILDGLNPLALTQQQETTALAAATSLPDANARTFTLSTETLDDESHSQTGDPALDAGTEEPVVDETPAEEEPVVEEEPVEEEEVTDEQPADEDVVDETDENSTDEDSTDEDSTDEDSTDEDSTDEDEDADEDAGEDEDADESVNDGDITTGATTPGSTTTGPKHAKPDNDSDNDTSGAGTDSDTGSNDGSSGSKAA